ncbi:MAG: hypothetical protein IH595_08250 [Bacteroidales bacterium]|nr:hypothetical protein [Bacteroidales bacterium]
MEQNQKRPVLLTLLCILTFIGGGMTLFSNTVIYLMFDQFKNLFASHPNMEFLGTKMDFAFVFNLNKLYFLSQGIFSGLALAGAFLMWNLKKIGFHLYVLSQLILLIIPEIFIPHLPFPLFQLSISFLFVYFYYKHLSIMQ